MLYFAYGSNMSGRRLEARVPVVRTVGVGRLDGHRLCFHKHGGDGSAKCDIVLTGVREDAVYGVVYEIETPAKLKLDRVEGLGHGYAEKQVSVAVANGTELQAVTYYALKIDAMLSPYHWYKAHVLIGARENGLPDEYIRMIEAIDSRHDYRHSRWQKEMAIYTRTSRLMKNSVQEKISGGY